MSDREAAGLRGPVAVCETEHIEKGTVTRDSFRRDGQRTEQWHRNRDGFEWSIVRRYDADGRVLEEERSAPQAQILAYAYDLAGRLARVDVRSPGGPERKQESYQYKDDQTSVVTLYIDPPLRDRKNVAVSAGSMLHMSIDAVRIITIRDSKATPTEKVLYDVDNRMIRRVLFRYDGAGRLLAEGEAEPDERMRADMHNSYRYNASGRCIQALMRWGATGGHRKTMSYNDLGDLVEERVVPLPSEVALHATAPWSTHYDYEYDTRGNLTSRTEQVRRLHSDAVIRTEVIRRRLKFSDSSESVI